MWITNSVSATSYPFTNLPSLTSLFLLPRESLLLLSCLLCMCITYWMWLRWLTRAWVWGYLLKQGQLTTTEENGGFSPHQPFRGEGGLMSPSPNHDEMFIGPILWDNHRRMKSWDAKVMPCPEGYSSPVHFLSLYVLSLTSSTMFSEPWRRWYQCSMWLSSHLFLAFEELWGSEFAAFHSKKYKFSLWKLTAALIYGHQH